jgi:16S rRNA (guanine527-N7)-methyltransferase
VEGIVMGERDRLEPSLAPLADRFGLGSAQRGQLACLLAALAGAEHAPTAVRDQARALDVHIADSLVALELELVGSARLIADLGAGAGFPGLALAVALPDTEVRLVDSQARKCAFIEELIAAAGLENARAICARAEEWEEGLGAHDLLTARALASQATVLEYAAPLMRVGGSLIDWRGERLEVEESAALRAAAQLGLRRVEVRRMAPFAGARAHYLHLFLKEAETPPRFPRRAGVARKRPLGA